MSMTATYEREYTKSGCGCDSATASRTGQSASVVRELKNASDCKPCVPQLAIASVPVQQWEQPYNPGQALTHGTIFPSLDKPFYKTGGEFRG